MTVQLIDLLKTQYGIDAVMVQPIPTGVMNHNFLVKTADETYVLKAYATHLYRPEWIRQTCEAQDVVRAAGVPVPHPIRTVDGDVLCETGEGFYLLSPYIDGRHHKRKHIPAKAAYEMGRTLGRLLDALRHMEGVTPFVLPDPMEMAVQLRTLRAAAARCRAESAVDEIGYQVLCAKVEALDRLRGLHERLKELPSQWVHGDYHDCNVLFNEADRVVAVLDFDNFRCRPRGYEVMRTMSICFFNGQLLPEAYDFFAGFVEAADVHEEEIKTYAPLLTYLNTVQTWPLQTRYENRAVYDTRWDLFIVPPSDWWERHMDEVTDRLLAVLEAIAAKVGVSR